MRRWRRRFKTIWLYHSASMKRTKRTIERLDYFPVRVRSFVRWMKGTTNVAIIVYRSYRMIWAPCIVITLAQFSICSLQLTPPFTMPEAYRFARPRRFFHCIGSISPLVLRCRLWSQHHCKSTYLLHCFSSALYLVTGRPALGKSTWKKNIQNAYINRIIGKWCLASPCEIWRVCELNNLPRSMNSLVRAKHSINSWIGSVITTSPGKIFPAPIEETSRYIVPLKS